MHPILFDLGPIRLYSYGGMIALGFLAAMTLASRRALAIGMDPAKIRSAALAALLFGVAGARLAYWALHWDFYRGHLLELFRLDHGGLVFYGGFAGGLAGVVWAARRHRIPLLRTLDMLTPPLVFAHAIGRIGCFLNGCCYGKFTSLPWGVAFPPEAAPRHPTPLYEFTALLFLFLVLKQVERRSRRPGTVLATYGLLYGSWRFGIEFLRGDNPVWAWNLTPFQWVSVPLALLCGIFLGSSPRRAG